MNSFPSQNAAIFPKRRLSSDLGYPNTKKTRVSDVNIKDFVLEAGKEMIGNPTLFSDGVAISWRTSAPQLQPFNYNPPSAPQRVPNLAANIESGSRSEPIYILDDDEPIQKVILRHPSSSSSRLQRLITPVTVPPRHRKLKIVPDEETPTSVIKLELPALHVIKDESPSPLRDEPDRICRTSQDRVISVRSNNAPPLPLNTSLPFSRRGDVHRWPDNGAMDRTPLSSSFNAERLKSIDSALVFGEIAVPPAYPAERERPLYGALRIDLYEDNSEGELESSPPPPDHELPPAIMAPSEFRHHPAFRQDKITRSPDPLCCSSDSSDESDDWSDVQGSDSNDSDGPEKKVAPRKRRRFPESHAIPQEDRQQVHPPPPPPMQNHSIGSAKDPPLAFLERRLPPTPHGRPRRVLVPQSPNLPIVTISMRADAQFFRREGRDRITSYSLPCDGDYQHVQDAYMIKDTVIVGYSDGPWQVSQISLRTDKRPHWDRLHHRPHHENPRRREGSRGAAFLSCLTPARHQSHAIAFYTGGHDKAIKLWTVRNPMKVETTTVARSETVPYTLASRDRTLLYGTTTKLLTVDIEHTTAKPQTAHFSDVITQIHVHPDSPHISILEVKSLDEQVLIYDHREKQGFDRTADIRFGYRSKGHKFQDSRYFRGSTRESLFARGYQDGCVCIWDYRFRAKPVVKAQLNLGQAIVHTFLTKSEVWQFIVTSVLAMFKDKSITPTTKGTTTASS
ncbi:hypothetical protein Hypma_010396 [Hypsizygus marmoreus]|uniref:Uncharacterized protein n=1 Tax=Hypsizygus marmoreus TaxID=39966 RepID=A0A369JQP7_HYPMA|nr:hypothetical protein Hypma_010396 [Hypsizygus marmoreus]